MIDPHVHLRDGEQKSKETIAHGLSVASFCGFQWVFDMPNCVPPLVSRRAIEARLRSAEDAMNYVKKETGRSIRYSLYAGLQDSDGEVAEAVDAWKEFFPHVCGLKLFAGNSTGGMGLVTVEEQGRIYKRLSDLGYTGVLAVHCEKESLLHPEKEDPADFSTHSLARPEEAEVQSVRDQIALAEKYHFPGHLHICHVSTVHALEAAEDAKKRGLSLSVGCTPHHLLLTLEMAKDRSLYAKMNPPLREEGTRAALFQAVLDGRVDWIESDHAPHTLPDKEKGMCGIPGFSGMLLLLARLREAGLSEERLASLFGGSVLKTFGLGNANVTLPPAAVTEEESLIAASLYPFDSYRNLR